MRYCFSFVIRKLIYIHVIYNVHILVRLIL